MKLIWLSPSRGDLLRLYDFLKDVNPPVAAKRLDIIVTAIERLIDHPRMGARVDTYDPREVRSLIVLDYEVHYELTQEAIIILRLWHAREDR